MGDELAEADQWRRRCQWHAAWQRRQLVHLDTGPSGMRIDFDSAKAPDGETIKTPDDLDPRIIREPDLELRTGRPA